LINLTLSAADLADDLLVLSENSIRLGIRIVGPSWSWPSAIFPSNFPSRGSRIYPSHPSLRSKEQQTLQRFSLQD
jgi:hypothetical protein